MADKFPWMAAEDGYYRTTAPNPHVDLSATAIDFGSGYPSRTFAAAAADANLDFDTTETCTVIIISTSNSANWAIYEAVTWNDSATDYLDLSVGTQAAGGGTLSNGDPIRVWAIPPVDAYVPVPTSLVLGQSIEADGAGNWQTKLHNFAATVAPTANEDSGDGYSVGSIWIDVTGDEAYVCVDATAAAAVWQDLSGISDILEDTTPQLGADLDANAFDILFDDLTGIRDSSDNETLIFGLTASAVNYAKLSNAATGNGPIFESEGETNVPLTIRPKGTGGLNIAESGDYLGFLGATAVQQQSHVADASTSHALNVTFDDTEVEAALNALGTTINSIIATLENFGFHATS